MTVPEPGRGSTSSGALLAAASEQSSPRMYRSTLAAASCRTTRRSTATIASTSGTTWSKRYMPRAASTSCSSRCLVGSKTYRGSRISIRMRRQGVSTVGRSARLTAGTAFMASPDEPRPGGRSSSSSNGSSTGRSARAGLVSTASSAFRQRLSVHSIPQFGDQRPHGRVWRLPERPGGIPARGYPGHPRQDWRWTIPDGEAQRRRAGQRDLPVAQTRKYAGGKRANRPMGGDGGSGRDPRVDRQHISASSKPSWSVSDQNGAAHLWYDLGQRQPYIVELSVVPLSAPTVSLVLAAEPGGFPAGR